MRLIDAEHLKRWIMLRWESGVSVGYDDVKTNEILEQIDRELTINPKSHWIPCSERLPEEKKEVLISADGDLYIAEYEMDHGKGYWSEVIDYGNVMGVDAWMPLPKPFRPKEEK